MNQTKKFAIHLDNLRRKSKITVNDLCDNIVDPRTYRRYLTGERTLTHLKVIDFCEKLGISTTDFYYSASEYDKYEFKIINDIYHLIEIRDFDKFVIQAKEINRDRIIEKQNRRFYDFCNIKVDFVLHKKTDDEVIRELSRISDYPNCIGKKAFDFVDLVALQVIAEIEINHNKEDALNLITNILHDTELIYTTSKVTDIIPSIYANLSIFLLRLNKFEESNSLATKGLEYSLRFSNISGLAYLYYCKSYSLLRLGDIVEAEIYGIKCVMAAIVKNDRYEIELFDRVLTSDFKYNPFKLISKYETELKLEKDDEN